MEPYDYINFIIKVISTIFKVKKAVEAKQEVEYQTELLKTEAKQAEVESQPETEI